jgi:hypothetical protein
MSLSKLTFVLTTFACVCMAGASSATLTLSESAWVGQTELKPGEYKVEVQGDKAVFKKGKQTVEVPVNVDNSGAKYSDTTVESSGSKIQKIHLGGSNTTITIKPTASIPTAVGNGAGTGIGQ